MFGKIVMTMALLTPVVLGATVFWTLSGSAEPIHAQLGAADASLALNRPVSGAQPPPTLAPRSSAAIATPIVAASSPIPTVLSSVVAAREPPTGATAAQPSEVAQAPSQPALTSHLVRPSRADAAGDTRKGKPKGKHRD